MNNVNAMYIAHYKQFIVADATRKKNIKIPNKVTEVIYCHCKAAASIMRATVLVLSVYTRITIWISARQIGQPVPLLTRVSTQVAQNRAWPQGTSATPSRCPIRHLTAVVCRCRWRRRCGSRRSRCSSRWLVVGVIFVADGRVVARLQNISVHADAVTHGEYVCARMRESHGVVLPAVFFTLFIRFYRTS